MTFNEMHEVLGEELYLVYETIVDRLTKGQGIKIETLQVAHLTDNLREAQEVINWAKSHAIKELQAAGKHTEAIKILNR